MIANATGSSSSTTAHTRSRFGSTLSAASAASANSGYGDCRNSCAAARSTAGSNVSSSGLTARMEYICIILALFRAFTPMEDWVHRALKRWPNVPALYGWLRLDRRGRWLIQGETIGRTQIVDVI